MCGKNNSITSNQICSFRNKSISFASLYADYTPESRVPDELLHEALKLYNYAKENLSITEQGAMILSTEKMPSRFRRPLLSPN